MTFHDTSPPVIPTERSEWRDPGSITDIQNPEAGDGIPPLRGLASAPVGMTVGAEERAMTNHDIS